MNSLEEYGNLFQKLGLTELVVEENDFKLKLKKEIPVTYLSSNTVAPTVSTQNVVQDNNIQSSTDFQKQAEEKTEGKEIKAPLLGIFYGKIADKESLKEGDAVKEGDILCTIEAMKMMNEVRSPIDGIVKKVLASEGDLVEYNQVLFVIG
ncbi:MAG: acetyl-CoA carboxylase, biotin carboxyl carrier protein [Butyrivibrio sp.]|nr:acetyl-CoA carboxylase, biotin carboxyl carrier protein [Butyrivibrio sp.]